jgi:hypothetical protein
MHDSEAISGSGMDVSSNVDSPQSQVRHLEKNVKDELVTATSVTQPSEEKDTLDGPVPNAKKSVPFMLAFAGLSAVMFVFHVDATCLGIALPVSNETYLLLASFFHRLPLLLLCRIGRL